MLVHLAIASTLFVFCFAVIYGAICDVLTYTIPNRVSYGLVLLFCVYAALVWYRTPYFPHMGFYIEPIILNVIYALTVFIFFVVFWKLGWVGGGDVKFVSAIALFMGLEDVLLFVILLSIIATLMLLVIKLLPIISPVFWNERLPPFIKNMILSADQRAIPYGLPAAVAALIVMPDVFARNY